LMRFSNRISALGSSVIRDMNSRANKDSINLGMGMPYCITPENIKTAGMEAIKNNKTFYTSNFGIPELRAAIAYDYSKSQNIEISSKNIMVTFGVAEAIFMILFSILDKDDEILIPDPGYIAYSIVANMLNGRIRNYKIRLEDEFGLRAENIINSISDKTRMIVLNSPGNPTGGVNNAEELKKLAEFCNERDIFLLSDEVYANLNYTGESLVSISRYIGLDKLIITGGVSKEFSMTGWRIGWIITNEENISQLLKAHQVIASCASSVSQYAALEAVKTKNKSVIESLAVNRLIMEKELHLFKNIKFFTPKGGMFFFADFSYYGDDKELAMKLLEKLNVITIPGSAFGESGKGFLRLSFGADPEAIKTGLNKIRNFLE
jgi:aspartate/methionine/tyrosine aminotransferase